MPAPLPDSTFPEGDNPLYMGTDKVMGDGTMSRTGTLSRQFTNPLFEDEEDSEWNKVSRRGRTASIMHHFPLQLDPAMTALMWMRKEQ